MSTVPVAAARLAETRVLRSIVVVFGISTLVFFALALQSIIVESAYLPVWWTVLATVAIFGIPPALAAVNFALSPRGVRVVLGTYAVVFLVVVVSYPLAMIGPAMPIALSPWTLGITAIGTVAAALVWRPVAAWAYLALNIVAMVVTRDLAAGHANIITALQDGFFSLSFTAIFTALALVALRNARAVDAASAVAQNAAARSAAAIARTREQARLDALVHDEVMSAFLYASQDSPALASAVRHQASRALEQLERIARGDVTGGVIDVSVFVDRMRAAAFERTGAVRFYVIGSRESAIPAEVASAFIEATSESVRNSLMHGGSRAKEPTVVVTLTLDEEGVVTAIEDDGVGFNPRTVSSHRLGIRVSIEGRLGVVPGGRAAVSSRPGLGALVTLAWTTP